MGSEKFVKPVEKILMRNEYDVTPLCDYSDCPDLRDFQAIAVLEHERNLSVIGDREAFIQKKDIPKEMFLIHICGNVDLNNVDFIHVPERPAPFGYMSYTTDFIDNRAVIDLHTAGLKVAEGMLKAIELGLGGYAFKRFMEDNYPALSFDDEKYW